MHFLPFVSSLLTLFPRSSSPLPASLDIFLPLTPAGIQKNLCKWYSNDPSLPVSIHPRKLAANPAPAPVAASPTKLASSASAYVPPTPTKKGVKGEEGEKGEGLVASAASPTGDAEGEGKGLGKLAALGAAEVEAEDVIELGGKAVEKVKDEVEEKEDEEEEGGSGGGTFVFPETSSNLTPAVLRTRLSGKKLKCVISSFRLPPSTLPLS